MTVGLPVHEVAERLAAHLKAVLPGWRESAYPLELMPYDSRSSQHQCWAVAVPTTVPNRDRQGSARGTVERGTQATTAVQVGWSWWLREQDAPGDYKAALAAELDLVAKLGTVDENPRLLFSLARLQRRVLPPSEEGGFLLLGVVELATFHRYPLEV